MAKWQRDAMLDAALADPASATSVKVCSAQPTTYAEANATYMLAAATVTAGAGNGSFTLANGDISGRKLTVAQVSNASITNSGTATHVALVITGSSTLLYVTTCTSQALTAGGTVTIPAWDIEIADAA